MRKIKVYTTPTCSHRKTAKARLTERGCEFDEIDITKNVHDLREWRAPPEHDGRGIDPGPAAA